MKYFLLVSGLTFGVIIVNKLLGRVENMNPRPSLSPKHDKIPIRVTALAFDLCVLYCTIAARVYPSLIRGIPSSSLSSKISGKEGDCKSNSISSQWLHEERKH